MISFKINQVPTLFIKAFSADDVCRILGFVRNARSMRIGSNNSILFIDTPVTAYLVDAIGQLKEEGYNVSFRDHHGIDGEPINKRDKQVKLWTAKLSAALGNDCQITLRRLHPACSTLVSIGEFEDAVAIIADPDPDGLTAAMKAAGISYAGLDDDAALLDGEPYIQVSGSPISQLLAKGMATLPSYDPKNPSQRERAQQLLFSNWIKAVQGNQQATEQLQANITVYNEAVRVAQKLATTAIEVISGVMLVDCVDKPIFDAGTLTALLEQKPGCRISVLRKEFGPIAALHGIQYSLSVAKPYQQEINLQKVLPPLTTSDPQAGVISNVSFLLHVSEQVWTEQVVHELHEKLLPKLV